MNRPGFFAIFLLSLLAAPPMARDAGAIEGAAPTTGASALQCRIAGIAYYSIQRTRDGSCSANSYIRVCAEAEQAHRQHCQEFCAAFKTLDEQAPCEGTSKPMAVLFDPTLHCREARQNAFEVSCVVMGDCFCLP